MSETKVEVLPHPDTTTLPVKSEASVTPVESEVIPDFPFEFPQIPAFKCTDCPLPMPADDTVRDLSTALLAAFALGALTTGLMVIISRRTRENA